MSDSQTTRKKIRSYVVCLDKPLGEGATSKVYLSYKSDNHEKLFATKIIAKSSSNTNGNFSIK